MIVYSPIYESVKCYKVDDVSSVGLQNFYQNGYGLGVDLVEHLNTVNISLYKCPKSNFQFYVPFDIDGDATYYKELEARNNNYYNTDSWEFYKTKKLISQDSKVLEIGSGNLSFLRLLKSKTKNVIGIELNDASVSAGVSEGFEMYNQSIEEFSKNNSNTFDVVCSFQVLEHIKSSELNAFISNALKCLKKGGRFIIAVPNNSSVFFKERKLLKYYSKESNFKLHCTTLALNMPPHHMGLWDEKSLKSLINKYPIKINSIHKEELADFRISLVKDILISKVSNYLGLKISKRLVNRFLRNRIIKKHYYGDSILVEFEKF